MNDEADLSRAFPAALRADAQTVLGRLTAESPPIGSIEIRLSSEIVNIPARGYFDAAKKPELDGRLRLILDCLLTRDWDGHAREAHLRSLLASASNEEWVRPFVWLLAGDYVIEIVQVIREHLDRLDRQGYAEQLAQNPAVAQLTARRAISYWDAYYRRAYKRFEDHPAFALFSAWGVTLPMKART